MPIKQRPIDEVYYLWQLAGSRFDTILSHKGILKARSSLKILPQYEYEYKMPLGNVDFSNYS